MNAADGYSDYLGDAVYASFDGYLIWLTTFDGNDQRIALEPEVFRALLDYQKRLMEQLRAAPDTEITHE